MVGGLPVSGARAALVLASCWIICAAAAAPDPAPPGCAPDGTLRFVCGPKNAEDLVQVGDSRWLLASGMDGQLIGSESARGRLYLINHESKQWQEAFPGASPEFRHDRALFRNCPGPVDTGHFSAHGLSLRESGAGRYRLYVTGHGAREAIEVFDVDATGSTPRVSWAGCVPLPDDVSANSVAILPDWGFVTTKFLDRRLSQQESFAQVRNRVLNGAVYEWRPGGQVKAIAGTELSAPNGIEVAPDGNTIYVAAFGSQELVRFRRDAQALRKVSVRLGITPDNLRWTANGRLLAAGGDHLGPDVPRTTAWSVVEIDPNTLASHRIAGAGRSAGMQGISVGLAVGDEIWLGTFAGDRVAYMRPENAP